MPFARKLRIEYHPAGDGEDAKTPDDFVTVDLATRRLVHFTGAGSSRWRFQRGRR
jgi:hypothetical protein